MWEYKYGKFEYQQIEDVKKYMRKQIYFLLLCVDPLTKDEYKNIDVSSAFDNVLTKFGGLNDILFYPPELVNVISLLQAALILYESQEFNFSKYRKLILDAGNEVLKIKEVK